MRRPSRRTLAILAGLVVVYFAGGDDALRWMRARWQASLQPPPVVDQGPRLPEPPPLPAALPREAVRGRLWLSDPPRPVTIAVVISGIMLGAIALMYFTGRPSRRSR
jgi:hypothetical protein